MSYSSSSTTSSFRSLQPFLRQGASSKPTLFHAPRSTGLATGWIWKNRSSAGRRSISSDSPTLAQCEGELEELKKSEQAEAIVQGTARILSQLAKLEEEEVKLSENKDKELSQEGEDGRKQLAKLRTESLYLCGDALLCLQRYDEALVRLDRALEIRPNYVDALLARGELFMELGQDKRAMQDFNEARMYDPNNADALFYSASLIRKTMKKISLDQHSSPPSSALPRLSSGEDKLEIQWNDGRSSPFHYVWLRHNCQCTRCVDTHSGQKLITVLDFPARPEPRDVAFKNGEVVVQWKDDHVSQFSLDFLRRYAYDTHSREERRISRRGAVPWNPDILLSQSSALEIKYSDLMESEDVVWQWLQQLLKFGYCLIRDVPTHEGEVVRVAQRMGQIRDTIYGAIWDVKSVENAANIAYSSLPIPPHMDLMYYEVPPGYQFLHCLVNQAQGGANIFMDTMMVAQVLRQKDEEAFRLLTTTPTTFHYQRSGHHLTQRKPIIELDKETGQVHAFRYAPTFEGPVDIDEKDIQKYYSAYRQLVQIINQDSSLHLWRTTKPGDLVTFDNRRILHARTAFSKDNRHLQGTYVDWDAFLDRYRVLQSKFAPGSVPLP